jgi:hypothetical protein
LVNPKENLDNISLDLENKIFTVTEIIEGREETTKYQIKEFDPNKIPSQLQY